MFSYGSSTITDTAGQRLPSANELAIARFQGKHTAQIAARLAVPAGPASDVRKQFANPSRNSAMKNRLPFIPCGYNTPKLASAWIGVGGPATAGSPREACAAKPETGGVKAPRPQNPPVGFASKCPGLGPGDLYSFCKIRAGSSRARLLVLPPCGNHRDPSAAVVETTQARTPE